MRIVTDILVKLKRGKGWGVLQCNFNEERCAARLHILCWGGVRATDFGRQRKRGKDKGKLKNKARRDGDIGGFMSIYLR